MSHADRAHSTWSASASARLWACAGSLRLTQAIPDRSGEAAAWGTAAHQISERCLRSEDKDASDFIGLIEQANGFSFEVDDEMAECAQEFIDYVRTASRAAEWVKIEQKFSLASLNPPFDAGGTADAVLYYPELRMLEVVDLKGGRGVVVEAKGNPQLRTYALGALLANPGLDVAHVQVTIVQPRAPHPDGRIRSDRFHVADLVEWTADLVAAMARSKEAHDAYDTAPEGAWATQYLKPGDHCDKSFCPARASCPALKQAALDAARLWFDDQDQPRISNSPKGLPPEERKRLLDAADMVIGFFNELRADAHRLAEMGDATPGYQLVDKRAMRKWKVDPSIVRQELFVRADLTDVFGPPKLLSVAQIEKKLGADRAKKVLAGLWAQESSGTNLVASTKTTRAASRPAVEKFFSVET